MTDPACEYCNRDDVTLYGWHADLWCADCMATANLPMEGTLETARHESGSHEYARPYIYYVPPTARDCQGYALGASCECVSAKECALTFFSESSQ